MAKKRTRKRGVSGKPLKSTLKKKKRQNNRDMADLLSGMTSMRLESPKKKNYKI